MKALTSFDLIRGNLRAKPFRTGSLMLIVAIFTATLFSSSVIGESLRKGTRVMAERLGADLLFVPHGYDRKLQGSLLRGEPSSFYLDGGLEKSLRGIKGVEKTTSQLFVASLNAACCTLPVQIIGFDMTTDFVVQPWIATALKRPLAEAEVVVGSKILAESGDKIMLFGKQFTVAAKLEATGMGFDTSVFMDIERARRLLLISDIVDLPEGLDRSNFVSSVLIKVSPPSAAKEVANAILRQHAIQYQLDFVVVAGMISDISGRLNGLALLFYGLSGILWLLSVGVLALVFSAMLQERKKELAMLRVMGATRGRLVSLMLCESFLLCLGGAVAGLTLACAVLFPFSTYINESLRFPSLWPGASFLIKAGAGTLLLGVAAGPLACVWSAFKLGRRDAYAALREDA